MTAKHFKLFCRAPLRFSLASKQVQCDGIFSPFCKFTCQFKENRHCSIIKDDIFTDKQINKLKLHYPELFI